MENLGEFLGENLAFSLPYDLSAKNHLDDHLWRNFRVVPGYKLTHKVTHKVGIKSDFTGECNPASLGVGCQVWYFSRFSMTSSRFPERQIRSSVKNQLNKSLTPTLLEHGAVNRVGARVSP
jgi:hypothetical protein